MRRVPLLLAPSIAIAMAVGVTVSACGESARTDPPRSVAAPADRFDAEAAWDLVGLQLRYEQRPAGSPQLRALARRLRRLLPAGRFERVPGRGLRNVVGSLPGREPGLVIGAHYDTLAAPKGFVGANNGAAGSAIVVQLARDLRRLRHGQDRRRISFVLFDGEEPAVGLPEASTDFYHQGLRGSRSYVRAHASGTGAMILLDYVGNRGVRLPREASSTPLLWEQVRSAAGAVGRAGTFPPGTQTEIIDDHTPFLRAGIPAVDLIDWSYDGHALSDTAVQLSRASIDAVGETLIEFVRRMDAGRSR